MIDINEISLQWFINVCIKRLLLRVHGHRTQLRKTNLLALTLQVELLKVKLCKTKN